MSNPLLSPDRFGTGANGASGPPATWPGGQAPGQAGAPPVPPAPDNVPGQPWPPPRPVVGARLRRSGVATATGVLLAIVALTAVAGWNAVTTETRPVVENGQVVEQTSISVSPWIFGAVILGFVLVLVCAFKPLWARFLAPIYAAAEGVFIGAVSCVFEAYYPGIVVQAVALTFGVFAVMLGLYASGRIRVTPKFRLCVIAATLGVCVVYLATFLLSLFGVDVGFIHEGGALGIAFSLVVVGIASLNLFLDFDFVDRAEQAGAPRQLEWFAALGLVVTLVWLYLEILRLLAKLRSR